MGIPGDNRITTLNITALLRRGRELDREKYQAEEQKKIGTLRAGNSGIRSEETGDIAAACHRKTILRSLGVEVDPPDDAKQIMFQLGYASEDLAVSDLQPTLPEGYVILQEADIPIDWHTENGTRVTGRPDLVICYVGMADGQPLQPPKPMLGLELKSVHSVWTAKTVLFEGTPKLANIAQAAHYMWKLGIPYKLIYKSYSHLGQGMSWSPKMAAMFPQQGAKYSEFMKYNDRGIPLQVNQFEIVYDLALDKHGRVKYKLENSDKWTSSLVTTSDIQAYYEFVASMKETGDLGPRPMNLDPQGNKESFNMCDQKYCPLATVCDKYEAKGFEAWLKAVKKELGK